MPQRGKRIVWNQTMLNVLTSGVRRKAPLNTIAEKLNISRTAVHNKIQSLRGNTPKTEKLRINQPAKKTLTGNVTLIHKTFTMTSKGDNLTITINQ